MQLRLFLLGKAAGRGKAQRRNGFASLALEAQPGKQDYARKLLACGNARDLKRIHEQLKLTNSELEQDSYIGNILINMYGKCGSWRDSQEAFNRIHSPNVISWSSLIGVYDGSLKDCLKVFQKMQLEGVSANNVTFVNLLKAFGSSKQLAQGKLLHSQIIESGFESDSIVGTTVMNMYVKCGSVEDANQVFERMIVNQRSASWSVLIAGYVSCGSCSEGLRLFYRMHLEGVPPDKIAFISVMTACSRPEFAADAERIYACVSDHGCREDVTVGNAALNMFGRCAGVRSAEQIFEKMVARSSASWNTMVGIYIQFGKQDEALVLFRKMLHDGGSAPDNVTFARVFSACVDSVTLEEVVCCMVDAGVEADVITQTVLVNLYSGFGKLERAREVFDAMQQQQKDVVLWNVMLAAYTSSEDFAGSFSLFLEMLLEGKRPDRFTFVSVFDTLTGLCDENGGSGMKEKRQQQQQDLVFYCVKETGLDSDVVLSNAVISMHGKAGRLCEAKERFNRSLSRDIVSWNAAIGALAENGQWEEALNLFRRMLLEGEKPNRISFLSAVAAASCGEVIEEARRLHAWIAEAGLESAAQVGNSVINMYAKCCSAANAEDVFSRLGQKQDVVSWTALLAAYDEENDQESSGKAVAVLRGMRLEGVSPTKVTLMTVLNIFAREQELGEGKLIHENAKELGLESDPAVASSLIDLYGECGCCEQAAEVFQKVASVSRDVVLWNAMISASTGDQFRSAEEVFSLMLLEGTRPSRITFAALLEVFMERTLLEQGKFIHKIAMEVGLDKDSVTASALLNFYGKCGKLEESRRVFEGIAAAGGSDNSCWNCVLAAYAHQGHAEEVMELFRRMQLRGIGANNLTFVSILSACSHSGRLQLARMIYQDMQRDFGVAPSAGESGCVVDLLGRTGKLQEAEEMVRSCGNDEEQDEEDDDGGGVILWSTLLAACNYHGDCERGERSAERLLGLEPERSSGYVALSNSVRCSIGFFKADESLRKIF